MTPEQPVLSDLEALYAAILAQPEEDTPRLIYADALDERGQPGDAARAEFIRVQVELDKQVPCSAFMYSCYENGPRCLCGDRWGMQKRETALLGAHRTEWLTVKCETCDGNGVYTWSSEDGGSPPMKCPDCRRGDAGGLTWRFDYLTGSLPSERREPVRVEFVRGFPHKVTVPRLADAVSEEQYPCMTCAKNRHSPGYIQANCRICQGRGNIFRTSASLWLAAVCRHHPIEQVVPLDTAPWIYNRDEPPEAKREYGWWEVTASGQFSDDEGGEAPAALFEIMWQEWVGSRHEDSERRWLLWDHREDAVDALAEAVVAFAKEGQGK